MTGRVRVNPVISLHLYTKWSKIVKTGGKLKSQGFSFFTIVKISTTKTGNGFVGLRQNMCWIKANVLWWGCRYTILFLLVVLAMAIT